ncbi:hypothetical protein ADIS_2832 [Lunatimonas lonarensis]|uniref:Uncharacterized protein n=1 Tax=Lunatimonas lonarensis TaxID=1232681 RepID=R7ZQM0_9BACT|nr:hypothetical protein ADIS_2832 [Lunatimonas lonarensis]
MYTIAPADKPREKAKNFSFRAYFKNDTKPPIPVDRPAIVVKRNAYKT